MLLDLDNWDLVVDTSGNIAVASNPYSIAQDIASAIRLFRGELWYDTTKGIPYLTQIFGQNVPMQFLKSQFVAAALTVPETVSSVAYITDYSNRKVTAQVQTTDSTGNTSAVTIPTGSGGALPTAITDGYGIPILDGYGQDLLT